MNESHHPWNLYVRCTRETESKSASTVFRLLGKNEDALTFALGYTLSRSHEFTVALLRRLGCIRKRTRIRTILTQFRDLVIILQDRSEGKHGVVRDITMETGSFRCVIEAKIDGSTPTVNQIGDYSCYDVSTDSFDSVRFEKEWGRHAEKYIVSLTRTPINSNDYVDLSRRLEEQGIRLLQSTWVDVQRLLKEFLLKNDDVNVHELLQFMEEDYSMKHFEHEIICIHVSGITYDMTLAEPYGYYFASRKAHTIYPECLFFCPVTGPSKRSVRTGRLIRRIEQYDILSAKQIFDLNNEMTASFKKQCERYPGDLTSDRVHAFKLGPIIDIPEEKQRMAGSAMFYKTLSDLLGRE